MTQWILTSSLLILAVLLIRALGRDRLSARVRYALWALVLLRLLVPFSIGESALSVQNWLPEEQAAELTEEQLRQYASSHIEVEIIENEPQFVPQTEASAEGWNTEQILLVVYGVGCVLVGGVFLVSNVRFALGLRRSRRFIIRHTLPVYETAAVDTPCLFGLFPKIYVTPSVREDENALRHVLAHELTHYRHGDHIWSILRCVCVTIHWYNPLVWIAAIISQKDAEMACDEGALRRLGDGVRTEYARTLLDMTCVGYRGMLTAATSMTGSDSDLKQRVKRIVKNPKMSAIAVAIVLVAAILVSLAVFTAAKAPAIEGVWRAELSYLGEGVIEPATAYMEYEFYEGRGCRTDYVDGTVRSMEWFNYIVDGETMELWFDGANDPKTYTFSITDDILLLSQKGREQTMIRVEQKELPFLPEGLNDIMEIHNVMSEEYLQLTDVQSAQLLYLLRSGEITVIQDYTKNGVAIEDYSYTVFTDQGAFTITDGVILGTRNENEDGYVLSNMDEIEYWLETFVWRGSERQVSGFEPSDLQGIVSARLIYNRAYPADPAKLDFLEELLSTSEPLGYTPGCPFDGMIEITLADGRVLGIEPALDSCATFMIWDTCYEYGNQFETDDEGSYDNSELLAVFGLTPTMLEEIMISNMQPVEGAIVGTNADVGDVVRILNDVMEPAFLSIDGLKTMQSLLWIGLGDAIGTEEVVWDEVYYSILNSDLPSKEDVVFLSDNGSLYMDGVRYELSTADELLGQLDAIFNEFRITQNGQPIIAVREAMGATVYLGLRGVTEDAEVIWTSEDETVCTVTGDAYGAEIYITGVGEAAVIAEYTENGQRYGYTIRVYGIKP